MLKEYLGRTLLEPRRTPYREIFVSRISGSAPDMALHFQAGMLAMWDQDGVTDILFEEPHGDAVQIYLAAHYPQAVYEGETGVPYSDWETGEPVHTVRAAHFLIQYTWENPQEPAASETRLVLDPGLAFGTGRHPSTRQSLALLRAAFDRDAPRHVLDLGCGTGVLSMAAAALGARRVTAVDYSLVAAHSTRMNAAVNSFKDRVRVIHGDAFDNLHHAADLVVCNLNHTLNRRLLASIHAKGTRRILLSGIHGRDRLHEIQAAARDAGYETAETAQADPWFSLLCRVRG